MTVMSREAAVEAAASMPAFGATHYAGFWIRFIAVCIDLVLCVPLYNGIQYLLPGLPGEAVFALLLIGLYAFFFSSRWQGTPGMYLLKFRITDAQGERIGFGRGLYWILTSLVIWLICFAGVVYLQSRFDLPMVQQLQRSCIDENIAAADCAREIESVINIPFPYFMQLLYAAACLTLFMLMIWALSIALPRDKTGFHNLLCGTRFLKGRP